MHETLWEELKLCFQCKLGEKANLNDSEVTVPCQTKHSPCSSDTDLLEPHTQPLHQLPRKITIFKHDTIKDTLFNQCMSIIHKTNIKHIQ